MNVIKQAESVLACPGRVEMIVEAGYIDLLVAHPPVKPRNRRELAELTTLLECGGERKEADARDGAVYRNADGAGPISKDAAYKLAELLQVSAYSFL